MFANVLVILLHSRDSSEALARRTKVDARLAKGSRKSRWRISQSASFLIGSDLGCLARLNVSSMFES